jgi:hypothetical protein
MNTDNNTENQTEQPAPGDQPETSVKLALIEQITQILTDAGHPDPMRWVEELYDSCPQVVDEEDVNVQRFIINNFWFGKLGKLDVAGVANTERARFSLQDRCSFPDWIRLFAADVLPCIMEHNL